MMKKQLFLFSMLVLGVDSFAPLSQPTQRSGIAMSRDNEGGQSRRRRRTTENLLDMDWREFRMRLVAMEEMGQATSQDNAEKQQQQQQQEELPEEQEDEKLAKQGRVSEMLAGALSSIFKGKEKDAPPASPNAEAFSGYTDQCVQEPTPKEQTFNVKSVNIDKRHWAHSIPHVEVGSVLLSSPDLGGYFNKTVILIAEHSNKKGTFGIILNRLYSADLEKISRQSENNIDLSVRIAFRGATIGYGGPISTEKVYMLHNFPNVFGSTKLADGVWIGGAYDLVDESRAGRFDQRNALFVKGYAMWTPDQLNKELKSGVWFPASVSSDFILRYAGTPPSTKPNESNLWAEIMESMGGKYAEIAKSTPCSGDPKLLS